MKSKTRFFSNLGYYFVPLLIVILTFIFLEQSQIVTGMPGYYFEPFDIVSSLLLVTVIVSLISAYTWFVIKKIDLTKNSFFVIVILSGVLLFMIFNIMTIPLNQIVQVVFLDGLVHDVPLSFEPVNRVISLLVLLVNFLFVIFLVVVLPNDPRFRKLVIGTTKTIVFLGFLALVYSLVFEFDTYTSIIRFGVGNGSNLVPESVFGNRNPYASFLLTSQLFLCFLYFLNIKAKKRVLFVLAMLPLVIGIHFTFSKTNIFLAYLIVIIIFYRHLFRLYKKHNIRFVFGLIASTTFIIVLFVYRLAPSLNNTMTGRLLNSLFPEQLFKSGVSTIKSRFTLWFFAITLIGGTPRGLMLGQGTHLSRMFYYQRMQFEIDGTIGAIGFGDYHNGFIEVFHTFGLLGFVVYIAFFAIVFSTVIKRTKTHTGIAYFVLASTFVFIARSQTESLSALHFKSEGIIASAAFVLPFLYLNHEYKDKQHINVND